MSIARYDSDRGGAQEDDQTGGYKKDEEKASKEREIKIYDGGGMPIDLISHMLYVNP